MTVPTDAASRRWLPWVVAIALFMEQLDTTIVNTAIPSIARDLGTDPLALKAVAASYIVSLAMTIPLAGWLADRFGTRRVFLGALALFTASSIACGLAPDSALLIAARVPQGMAAAMMMPVGRIALVRAFPKSQLLRAMNFVIVPALLGPLLGPTVGGFIVHTASWRAIFFVNVPVGLIALAFAARQFPDYRDRNPRPLDVTGLVLFGGGVALLSWVLEMFGRTGMAPSATLLPLALAAALLAAYVQHARRTPRPLLSARPFGVRSFRIAVLGGFATRLGVGGMPFLLPLLYQLGLGLPAWQSGLLMMPAALAAMLMKPLSVRLLRRFGHRTVLQANTLLVALVIALFASVGPGTPLALIVAFGLTMGLANSLQFSSMNSLAYADVGEHEASMAATIASTAQQLSLSFGLALGSITAALFLGHAASSDPASVLSALHHAFALLALLSALSALAFRGLAVDDGASVSRGVEEATTA